MSLLLFSIVKRSRLCLDTREDELFSQALSLSLKSDAEKKEKFKINCFRDMQDKLSCISLPKTGSLWYPDEYGLILMRPSLETLVSSVNFDLSVKAFCKGEISQLSISFLSDNLSDGLNRF